jgi:hypothetical protein
MKDKMPSVSAGKHAMVFSNPISTTIAIIGLIITVLICIKLYPAKGQIALTAPLGIAISCIIASAFKIADQMGKRRGSAHGQVQWPQRPRFFHDHPHHRPGGFLYRSTSAGDRCPRRADPHQGYGTGDRRCHLVLDQYGMWKRRPWRWRSTPTPSPSWP